jgi:hypothetical protein
MEVLAVLFLIVFVVFLVWCGFALLLGLWELLGGWIWLTLSIAPFILGCYFGVPLSSNPETKALGNLIVLGGIVGTPLMWYLWSKLPTKDE